MGGSFKDARIFRSRELANLTGEEAAFLSGALGIATIYDLRTAAEVAVARSKVAHSTPVRSLPFTQWMSAGRPSAAMERRA